MHIELNSLIFFGIGTFSFLWLEHSIILGTARVGKNCDVCLTNKYLVREHFEAVGIKKSKKKQEKKTKMSNFVQSFDREYESKKETGNWNRKGLAQTKKDDQASRQLNKSSKEEAFKMYKGSSSPSVKYTNRVYKAWEAREECNQQLESFKS